MAEYHVKLNENNIIVAGPTSKTGKFTNSSDVTQDALSAVRDYIFKLCQKEGKDVYCWWPLENDTRKMVLRLELREFDVKDGETKEQ